MLQDNISVSCPRCNRVQETSSMISKQCVGCGYNFKIISAKNGSRIVHSNANRRFPVEFVPASQL